MSSTHLNMIRLVLKGHEQHSRYLARERDLAGINVTVEVEDPLAYSGLVLQDARKGRPVLIPLRHLRMRLEENVSLSIHNLMTVPSRRLT